MIRALSRLLNYIRSTIVKVIKDPRKIAIAVDRWYQYYFVRPSRQALNWALTSPPRIYYAWAYDAAEHHPSFKTYDTHPPVRYTMYSLADICHFFNSVPSWNKKPFVLEFEHVMAMTYYFPGRPYSRDKVNYVQEVIASDLCRVALTLSKGLVTDSKRFISDTSLYDKFDYLYPCYSTQPSRSMDLSRPFTILTIATRFYDKGVHIALKAFGVLRERYGSQVQMILVCDCLPTGYHVPDGVIIYTAHPLSDTLKAKLYNNSHVLFLPVLSETFGCFPEAYAYGTPVVTTRIHHGDETVREGITGFLVDPPFYLFSDEHGMRQKTMEEFVIYCKQSFENGGFNNLIEQCVNRLERMISGDVDLVVMSAAAQAFHREMFSIEVRNQKLRQIYRRVAGLANDV